MSRWGMQSCREASLLLTQAEYEPLITRKRLSLTLHLALCGHCREFGRQQRLLSQATQRWRAYSEADHAD